MHYRNGRETKNGDTVISLHHDSGRVIGVGLLDGAVPGNDYCNGSVAPTQVSGGACLIDALHVDDVAAMIAEKGLDKRPAGK